MTGIIPAWKLQELIDIDELVEERRQAEERLAKSLQDLSFIAPQGISDEEEVQSLSQEEFKRTLRKATHPEKDVE